MVEKANALLPRQGHLIHNLSGRTRRSAGGTRVGALAAPHLHFFDPIVLTRFPEPSLIRKWGQKDGTGSEGLGCSCACGLSTSVQVVAEVGGCIFPRTPGSTFF